MRLRRSGPGTVLLVMLLLALAACTGLGPPATPTAGGVVEGPEVVVSRAAAAWQAKAVDQVAAVTTQPAVATEQLTSVMTNLAPTSVGLTAQAPVETGKDTATVDVDFVWVLGGGIRWQYTSTWTLQRNDVGWRVLWNPTMVHPKLGPAQTIALRTTDAQDGEIVDRNNQQLVSPVRVHSVVVLGEETPDVRATATALAEVLGPIDPTATVDSIVKGVADSPDGNYTVTNLRDADFSQVEAGLSAIEGLSVPSQLRQLPPTRDFARTVLSEAVPVANTMTKGVAGWRVVTLDSTGAELEVLSDKDPAPGTTVQFTLDIGMQTAAEELLAGIPEQAMLVAIEPSTGEILVVAQNAAANVQGPMALMGRYPPGSIFKIVTADAVLENDLATPSTVVPCPGQFVVDFRPIHNNDGFDLGNVTLSTAFAKSCNTTFAKFASTMEPDTLTKAAAKYGIGLDFVIPGITTLTGQAPVADSVVQQAEDGFGQGVILVTPFSAALMTATVANGSMPMPTLIRGTTTTVDNEPEPLGRTAATGLPMLMRSVVTDGTALALQAAGEVHAKTGTADNADPAEDGSTPKAHAWTVGYRGDIAFAALIVGGDSSKRTTDLLAAWLAAI